MDGVGELNIADNISNTDSWVVCNQDITFNDIINIAVAIMIVGFLLTEYYL